MCFLDLQLKYISYLQICISTLLILFFFLLLLVINKNLDLYEN